MIANLPAIPAIMSRASSFAAAVLVSAGLPEPAQTGIYHGLGPPPDDCCDYVLTWIERLYASAVFPAAAFGAIPGSACGPAPAVQIAMKIRRPCWPVAQPTPPFFPPSEATSSAAASLAADGVRVWCAMARDLSAPDSIILGPLAPDRPPVMLGELTPGPNTGGCAGWLLRFTVGLDGCCDIVDAPPAV